MRSLRCYLFHVFRSYCLEKKFGLQKAMLRYYDGISFVVQTSVSACHSATITVREVKKWVMPTFIKIIVCNNVQRFYLLYVLRKIFGLDNYDIYFPSTV